MTEENYDSDKIILFDGICNLCSSAVQFILSHEKGSVLRFAALQSEAGKKILDDFGIDTKETDSIVFIENGKFYVKSKAAIAISKYLEFPYKYLSFFTFVPRVLADWIYDIIAKSRYRFFGKKKECWIPQPMWRDRFL